MKFLNIIGILFISLLVIICIYFLIVGIWPIENPRLHLDSPIIQLSEETITSCDSFWYNGKEIYITKDLANILQYKTWARAKNVDHSNEEPILIVEMDADIVLEIYRTYACVKDTFAIIGYETQAYYTYTSDFSDELTAYLNNCKEKVKYQP